MIPDQTVCSPECQFEFKQRQLEDWREIREIANARVAAVTRQRTRARKAAGLPTKAQIRDAALQQEREALRERRAKRHRKRLYGISADLALWLADDR